jgi:multiple sugar transport system permease protein
MVEKQRKKIMTICFLLAPSLIGMLLFNLIPMAYSIYISLTDWNGVTKTPLFVGIQNYMEVFTAELSRNSFITTFKFLLLYIPAILLFSLMLAVMIQSIRKGRDLYRAVVFIPVIMSWVTVSFIWKWIFDPYGLLNYLLSLAGVAPHMWLGDEKTALPAIVVATIWKDLGYIAIILFAGLNNISQTYYEAASIDGSNALNRFFKITLPLLTPSLFFVVVISLINNFQIFDQLYIMTAGGPLNSTRTIVIDIYENAFRFGRMGFASAQALTLFVVIMIVTAIQNMLQKRWVVYETE